MSLRGAGGSVAVRRDGRQPVAGLQVRRAAVRRVQLVLREPAPASRASPRPAPADREVLPPTNVWSRRRGFGLPRSQYQTLGLYPEARTISVDSTSIWRLRISVSSGLRVEIRSNSARKVWSRLTSLTRNRQWLGNGGGRVRDPHQEPVGRVAFYGEPRSAARGSNRKQVVHTEQHTAGRGSDVPQPATCSLNLRLPEPPTTAERDAGKIRDDDDEEETESRSPSTCYD